MEFGIVYGVLVVDLDSIISILCSNEGCHCHLSKFVIGQNGES